MIFSRLAPSRRVEQAKKMFRSGSPTLLQRGEIPLCKLRHQKDPLSEALSYLILQESGIVPPPFIPSVARLPVSQLCELAVLWGLIGEEAAASELIRSLPFDFPWVWSREEEFNEAETKKNLDILRPEALMSSPRWSLIDAGPLRAALTFEGDGTGLGAIVGPEVEIRAFGPQKLPLQGSKGFGIRPIAHHEGRWSSPSAVPEIWSDLKMVGQEGKLTLDLVFTGLKTEEPLGFVFYIHAQTAQVGTEIIKPKSLQRYCGEARPVLFQQHLKLESHFGGKMELIPLAGANGFWNCEYLLAFEIHAFNARGSFSISLV